MTLFARIQDENVSIECIRKRVDADGERTNAEKDELLEIYERDWPIAVRLANTNAVLGSAFNGADGINSRNFLRQVRQLERDNLIEMFPEDPEPEPYDQRAA